MTRKKMEGKAFISRQSRHFLSVDNIIQITSLLCTLTWREQLCFPAKKPETRVTIVLREILNLTLFIS